MIFLLQKLSKQITTTVPTKPPIMFPQPTENPSKPTKNGKGYVRLHRALKTAM